VTVPAPVQAIDIVVPQQAKPIDPTHLKVDVIKPQSHGWIECEDPFGRARSVVVYTHEGRAMVIAPPGESAMLTPDQARRLAAILIQAAEQATDPVEPTEEI
jgi:hypothetical protein